MDLKTPWKQLVTVVNERAAQLFTQILTLPATLWAMFLALLGQLQASPVRFFAVILFIAVVLDLILAGRFGINDRAFGFIVALIAEVARAPLAGLGSLSSILTLIFILRKP